MNATTELCTTRHDLYLERSVGRRAVDGDALRTHGQEEVGHVGSVGTVCAVEAHEGVLNVAQRLRHPREELLVYVRAPAHRVLELVRVRIAG
eukprot:4232304-Pyramimonas_sp.AAC.1